MAMGVLDAGSEVRPGGRRWPEAEPRQTEASGRSRQLHLESRGREEYRLLGPSLASSPALDPCRSHGTTIFLPADSSSPLAQTRRDSY